MDIQLLLRNNCKKSFRKLPAEGGRLKAGLEAVIPGLRSRGFLSSKLGAEMGRSDLPRGVRYEFSKSIFSVIFSFLLLSFFL